MMKQKISKGAQLDLFSELETEVPMLLTTVLAESERVYVKKLSLNDLDWARERNKHQSGVYIPAADRDAGFFPPLETKTPNQPCAPEIREATFVIEWPTVRESKEARLVHYTSKGHETHLTRLPKDPFRSASPASLLVIGKANEKYRAIVVDSHSSVYRDVEHDLSLPPDFRSGIFTLPRVTQEEEEIARSFVEEAIEAFRNGTLPTLASVYGAMPSTEQLADEARKRYLKNNKELKNLNPNVIEKPGDVLLDLSRHWEWKLFKEHQIKASSIKLVRMIFGDDRNTSVEKAIRAVVNNFPAIDKLLLSASQQRKSRAGYSFEHHIAAMLSDGGIPFEKQVVTEARLRPDFILPNRAFYDNSENKPVKALILSAKTTLRERWKQVSAEKKNCDLYLATLDESITVETIDELKKQGIVLVVPESFKNSDTTVYKDRDSVISFKVFFQEEIAKKRWKLWQDQGIVGAA